MSGGGSALERLRRPFAGERVAISDGELLALMACNLLSTVGLAGDIANHLQNPGDLEGDFLSGWHLVLYGGVLSVALWLGVGALRHGPRFLASAWVTTVGFGLLAIGGAFDAVWHAQFGTEANVEALVSPPHLVVFAGLGFLLTSPIVAIWHRSTVRLGVVPSLIVLASMVSATLVTSLFLGFLSPLASGMSLSVGYVEPVVGETDVQYDQVRGLGIAVWTVASLVAALTVVLVRFRPHRGFVAVSVFLCGAPALFITDATAIRPIVVGYAVAGLGAEAMVGLLGRPTLDRRAAVVTGAVVGVSLWAATFALLGIEDRLAWSEAMWAGTVLLGGMVGAAVAGLVALPMPVPPAPAAAPEQAPGPRMVPSGSATSP